MADDHDTLDQPRFVPAPRRGGAETFALSNPSAVHKETGVFGSRRPATAPEPINARYADKGEVGRGGMGSVRRVYDKSLLRLAAVKVLHADLATADRQVQRFVDEAQITGQLDHPNIVPIHELGIDDAGNHYFSMKLVQGKTLDQMVEDAGSSRLDADRLGELLQVFVKVCDAVAFAHHRGVIHRDLKPLNVMVGEFGQVYLMDWGLAYLAEPGTVDSNDTRVRVTHGGRDPAKESGSETILGTPRYMAPEQVDEHGVVDERTDVFALGGMLYHILTGHAPYTQPRYFTLLVDIMSCEIPEPAKAAGDGVLVPQGLSRIAMKALSPSPSDRYSSVLELKQDIERFLRGAWNVPIRAFRAGATIVRQGELGDTAYILVEGRCAIVDERGGKRRVLRELGPGEVFGETAVFAQRPRTATVEALEPVRAMVVDREALTSGLGLSSWMGIFVKALADRFVEVDEQLRGLERELGRREG